MIADAQSTSPKWPPNHFYQVQLVLARILTWRGMVDTDGVAQLNEAETIYRAMASSAT